MSLTYTRDLPTKPGWYWCKRRKSDDGMIWYLYKGPQIFDPITKRAISLSDTHYRWFAGPIEEPK